MSIGGDGGDRGDAVCAVCGLSGTKTCSRCKKVRYCSQACQSKHWEEEHKFKCKQMGCPDRLGCVRSEDGACRRRKYSGFDPVSLVPARGSSKVLQKPKKIPFPYEEFIKLFNWDNPGFPPCGLINSGNSCFANVVLQCLACTRPLTTYLLEGDHLRSCSRKQENWCFLCELQAHIQRASRSRQPFSPINILSRIPNIGGNLGCESQEDAHEFMRFTIDTMQSICLDEYGGEKASDPSIQETTLIQHIFGGHFLSQVKCTKCEMVSNRYENMMDLTVEIHGDAESLEECLEQFTARESLDGNNMYKCDGCNGYVEAWKRLTIHQAPNILTIALKRFQSGRFGKINKRVTFPEELDISPYMSEGGDGTDMYSLYAVVVHVDMLNASFFGHYICYTKDYHGRWYRIDDCQVTNVEVEEVLSQRAYMLLYSRVLPRKHPLAKPIDSSNVHVGANVCNGLTNLPCNIASESNPSLLRDTGHERLSEIISDTTVEYGDMELEVEPMLVDEDIEDIHIKDIECEENVSTSNSHIEDKSVTPSSNGVNKLSSPSKSQFFSPGFLSRSYSKSAAKVKLACSGEKSGGSSDMAQKTGSEAACSSENSSGSTAVTTKLACSSEDSGSEAAFSSESSSMSIDFTAFHDKENGRISDGGLDGLPKQMNGICSQE